MTSVESAIRLIRWDAKRCGSLERAATLFVKEHPAVALDAVEAIGTWPSSEPELRALQLAWERA